ncbi:MAG: DUF1553 domain-containing protein, partial [Verrucomicrobiota bacterium]
VEVVTGKDAPLLTKGNGRSWFGIRQAVVTKSGEPGPNQAPSYQSPILAAAAEKMPSNAAEFQELQQSVLSSAVEAWREETLTDEQAELLAFCLAKGLLPNQLGSAKALIEEYRKLEAEIPIPTRVPGLVEWKAADQPLYDRGDHKKPLEAVPRRFLDAIDPTPYDTDLSGRLELAEDLLRDDNPFTRRVIVNRVWHHLFGAGLVRSADNFGRLGEEPTHPQLLDHLAAKFVSEKDWSLKSLIKYLVTTQTWRQASQPSEVAKAKDPDNRLLSHFSVSRLESEAIRDSILAVSNGLNSETFGPPAAGNSNRRSVYVNVIRNRLDPFLTTFGSPEPFSTTGARPLTNVPAQSLMLMNDNFVISAANRFANATKGGSSDSKRVEHMWLTALGRGPSDAEQSGALALIDELKASYGSVKSEQARITDSIGKLRGEHAAILNPVRDRLLAEAEEAAGDKPAATGPAPFAFWDFEEGLEDKVGNLHGKAIGSAKVEGGALVVDGNGLVLTGPIGKKLAAKTMEVLVLLDDLNQKAGGAMTVQALDGGVFDSIVYAEKRSKRWLAGSNNHRRTLDFNGTDENEANGRPVRITMAFDEDGVIRGYRDGKPYGEEIRKADLQTFDGANVQVAFGIRHGTGPGGNRMLRGRILEAKLYDRALEPGEIAAAAGGTGVFVSQKQVMEALTDQQRERLSAIDVEIANLEKERNSLGNPASPEQAWNDLAHSIFNLKEFIYVR